jgi:hypothetical protein
MTRSDEELFTVFCAGSDQGQHMIAGYRALYEKGLSDAAPRWIAVTERLPKRGEAVIARDKFYGSIGEAVCYDAKWSFVSSQRDDCSITHWQPMPEFKEPTK